MKESTLSPTLNRVNSGPKDSFGVGRGTKGKKSDRSAHSSKHGSFIAITSQQQLNSSRENNDFTKQHHLLEQPYQIVKVHPDCHNLNQVSKISSSLTHSAFSQNANMQSNDYSVKIRYVS